MHNFIKIKLSQLVMTKILQFGIRAKEMLTSVQFLKKELKYNLK